MTNRHNNIIEILIILCFYCSSISDAAMLPIDNVKIQKYGDTIPILNDFLLLRGHNPELELPIQVMCPCARKRPFAFNAKCFQIC